MSENFEKLELTPRNVYRIMKECQKTDTTKNVVKTNFYTQEAGKKAPFLEFDREKLNEYRQTIGYLVGQLHAIHTHHETMLPSYGAMDYKGNDWTKGDNMALFSFFYLATVTSQLPHFDKGNKGGVASPIGLFKIKPTFWPPEEE